MNATPSDRPIDVIVAGHICLDIIPKFPESSPRQITQLLRPGKLVNMERVTISTGGPVSNTGIGLKISGLNVAFMAKIGDDDFGKLVLDRLKKEGNAAGIRISTGEATSYTVALAPPEIDRIFLHHAGANATFNSDDIDYEILRQARIFHLGYPPLLQNLLENEGTDLVELCRRVKQTGITTSVDMSLPDPASPSGKLNWPNLIRRLLPHIDIFLPSIEEAYFITEPENYRKQQQAADKAGVDFIDTVPAAKFTEIANHFLDLGTKIVAIKTAHRGFYLRTASSEKLREMGAAAPADPEKWADREIWCPAFQIDKIASATGSGDSSIAGFFGGFLRHYTVEKTLKCANCLGYQNLQQLDALSGLVSWKKTEQLVDSRALPMRNAQIDDPAWTWDNTHELWIGPNNR
ncbi:carbohydrate kinase family protein [bacterium]|nr:carbohydrate kinase family protein [bacterium]